jgi:glycosyltransferase involved in cell wall biosynthesis
MNDKSDLMELNSTTNNDCDFKVNMFSIVVATFNSEKTISQCIESIFTQTFQGFEVIIKDGGSTDRTVQLIEKYKEKYPIILICSSDTGVYNAWNIALLSATGKWVTFLGSDDYFTSSNTLSKINLEVMNAEKANCEVVYGKNNIVTIDDEFVEEIGSPWAIAKKSLHSEMSIRHPGCFCSLSLLYRLKGFDESFSIIGDYDFTLSAFKTVDFYFYDFTSINHRVGGLSISPSRMFKVINETIKLRRKHKIFPSLLLDKLFFKRAALYALSLTLSDKSILEFIVYMKKRFK